MLSGINKSNKLDFIAKELQEREKNNNIRQLKAICPQDGVTIVKNGKSLINFSSNDYLGLSKHPSLMLASQNYTKQYGTGSTASRLVTGTYDIHEKLEQKLAKVCGKEAALLFNTGFQANTTIIPSLVDQKSLVLCDRLVHNSILQGIFLSKARWKRYQHNDLSHLERLLKKAVLQGYNRILIVTETVFSMEGDRSDVDGLIQLSQQYNTLLYLDDAHALGIMGEKGMGLTANKSGIDISLGTFGKAIGSFGAFITTSKLIRDYLINCCPGFIYTTALPPAVIGSIDAAIDLVPSLDQERTYLGERIDYLQNQLINLGYKVCNSISPIIPVIIGDEEKALNLSQYLETNGILATAIRPPTVPKNTARIRFVLSSKHQPEQINYLISLLKQYHES
ncbi:MULTISPECIES: 8-amino-7-oxononanoate synthase [Crocosphaera]|uniref:8-amino-7-ketopelargonate synthase n=3 Tax=Crocosphaera watsonii TaxID=263511 RepID=T2JZY0_CROWT|nr:MULTISPECIES: 8-amino-7-oxononanoate synthase [Crocosphaera]EHJ13002.1 8-amino-7-oxononanoate synthase [Crocosphaera watsonii WH 0003]MCH2243776.1 8-amino-7-oxononanoate synthase [Crocosphaera sp.]NQZ60896.1 8-amino-7-oxononanoate synthase [Crocosphaera sp.]CCQ57677.1 8-amino-7-oxononanoate synthase [Crocosphaera watsonii WH 0005]CCQ70709.1 8-amino-7-oxononanoate synthase [Crocosphaera watsonii WH 0402]